MNISKTYDVIVIGAGSGGLSAAVGFTKIGKKVLLIEREHMGGECTNSGCIPSKALLHHAKAYYGAKMLSGGSSDLDAYRQGALAYTQGKIDEILKDEKPEDFEKMGMDVVLGEAIFEKPCVLIVGEKRYGFKKAIIATGSSPREISIQGLKKEDILTNQNIFTLSEIPENLLVIGAGPIGLEMGQAFAMLGSNVTIVSRDDRFAALEDEKISPILQKKFEDMGVRILLRAELKEAQNRVGLVTVRNSEKKEEIIRVPYDKVLLAIGRVPNIPQGLKEAGIAYDERSVLVDKQYRTSNKDVYAIGDVSQKFKFTHTADDTARQVVTRIASKQILRVNRKKAIPKVTFTSPEVASVGMSNKDVCKKYDCTEYLRIEVPYTKNDRAKTDSASEGLLVLIVRKLTGTVLGANIIGPSAGEIIAVFTLAIDQKISMWKLRSTIYAYPTYSLIVKRAGDMFFAETMGNLKSDLKRIARKHVFKLIALVFWAALLFSFHEYRVANDLTLKEMLIILYDFVTTTTWGPVVYMLVYALRPLIFFPATLLTALSGLIFGLPLGILYTIVGENMSANLAYWIGRFFEKDMRLEDSFMGRWVEALCKRPFMSVLFMRLFYVPFDLTNYGSGILKVKWRAYALATFIGIMPGLATFVALGAGIKDIRSFELSVGSFDFVSLGVAIVVFVVSLMLSKYLKRWHSTREKK